MNVFSGLEHELFSTCLRLLVEGINHLTSWGGYFVQTNQVPNLSNATQIKTILDTVYKAMLSSSNGMMSNIQTLLRAITGIGMVLYIFSRLIAQIFRNEPPDFFPYLRPFAMLILITLSPDICDALDTLGDNLVKLATGDNDVIKTQIQAHFDLISQKMLDKETVVSQSADAEDKAKSLFQSAVDAAQATWEAVKDVPQKLFLLLLYTIQLLLQALFFMGYALMYLFSISYRVILRTTAPIVFVVSIFPGFTNNLLNWFGKYVNFILLPFVATLYGNLSFQVLNTYLANYDTSANMVSNAEFEQLAFFGVAYIALLAICIIGYFQVPSMTEMLVSIGGVGALAQGATNAASRSTALTTKAGKIVAAPINTMGNAAMAAGAAMSGATVRSFGNPTVNSGSGGSSNGSGSSGGGNQAPLVTPPTFSSSGQKADKSNSGSSSSDAPSPASGGVNVGWNQGTMARSVQGGVQKGGSIGERAGQSVGAVVGKVGQNLSGESNPLLRARAAQVGGSVGKFVGSSLGAGMALTGESMRFGWNVVSGTVKNYNARTSAADMPMTPGNMMSKNNQDNTSDTPT